MQHTTLKDYQDYINLFNYYFDPHLLVSEQEPIFAKNDDSQKILPVFTTNINGYFQSSVQFSFFTKVFISNLVILDMIQDPYIENVVQTELFDHSLLYLNDSKSLNNYKLFKNELNLKFFQDNRYNIFGMSSGSYYFHYREENTDDLVQKFKQNLFDLLAHFKTIYEHMNINEFHQSLEEKGQSIFNKFSYLLNDNLNKKETDLLADKILKNFLEHKSLVYQINDNIDVVSHPICENTYLGSNVLESYINLQQFNLDKSKEIVDTINHDDILYFYELKAFLDIGISCIHHYKKFTLNDTLITPKNKRKITDFYYETEHLFEQSSISCLKIFIDKVGSVKPDSDTIHKEKKLFLDKYANNVQKIEAIYNEFDISLFFQPNFSDPDPNNHRQAYLDIDSFKIVLPIVMECIDDILVDFDKFYNFKLDQQTHDLLRTSFKNNLFVSLCQNYVSSEIFHDLHLNYESFLKEISLRNKLDYSNKTEKPHRQKI